MESINVYFFDTFSEAEVVVSELNQRQGLPTADGSTLTYCAILPHNDKWYIPFDQYTQEVVGREPDILEIKLINPFDEL